MTKYAIPDTDRFKTKHRDKNTHLIVLQNQAGMQVALTDYGARIVSILVPNSQGEATDVALGFGSIADYLKAESKFLGTTVGRYANRIANARFELDGQTYQLEQNNGSNCLHSGKDGFHDQVWDRQTSVQRKVDFYYTAKDGESGFPGNLNVHISYELTDQNELKIAYRAVTDRKTVLNLTNHAYFNLHGEGQGEILDHLVYIPSQEYITTDENQIPSSAGESVENTPFDFRERTRISDRLDLDHPQLKVAAGFDHSYVVVPSAEQLVASALSEQSGIQLDVFSTEPSVHFYIGSHLLGKDTGKSGVAYQPYSGFCFETQHFPNSPNDSKFPSVTLDKGQEYQSKTTYKFSLNKKSLI
ncbi:aldose epimerase family protein [Sphingobacterium corticis]|uniref:Aldose 1-epimerase n=1 Tax=Sphingobacterium corticis TaxID=1812823 RepID=A0ABW5NMQ8_9SPHI